MAHGVCIKFNPNRYLAIGVPVWAGDATVICSLACALPATMASPKLMQTILDALWTATADVSPRLGCTELPYPKPVLTKEQLNSVRR